jgi:hypothetical protein
MYLVAICRLQIVVVVETGQDVNDSEFKFDNEPTATNDELDVIRDLGDSLDNFLSIAIPAAIRSKTNSYSKWNCPYIVPFPTPWINLFFLIRAA